MKSSMNICIVDLRHAQTTKTTTNKTKTIQDYLSGSSVHKSTCSRQLGTSLQLGLMRYFKFASGYSLTFSHKWGPSTNKTKTIKDYLGGSSVQKLTCSRQLGSSLQLGLMRYFKFASGYSLTSSHKWGPSLLCLQ